MIRKYIQKLIEVLPITLTYYVLVFSEWYKMSHIYYRISGISTRVARGNCPRAPNLFSPLRPPALEIFHSKQKFKGAKLGNTPGRCYCKLCHCVEY